MNVLFVSDDDLTKSKSVYDIHVLAEGLSLGAQCLRRRLQARQAKLVQGDTSKDGEGPS